MMTALYDKKLWSYAHIEGMTNCTFVLLCERRWLVEPEDLSLGFAVSLTPLSLSWHFPLQGQTKGNKILINLSHHYVIFLSLLRRGVGWGSLTLTFILSKKNEKKLKHYHEKSLEIHVSLADYRLSFMVF